MAKMIENTIFASHLPLTVEFDNTSITIVKQENQNWFDVLREIADDFDPQKQKENIENKKQ